MWSEVVSKRNGIRPQKRNKPSYWGEVNNNNVSQDLVGAERNDVFLFNYKNIATPDVVKNHFIKHHINVVKIYQRSNDEADVKSFVMRIANRYDFEKITKVLPYKTGARWYVRNRNENSERPPAYYNRTASSDAFILDRPIPNIFSQFQFTPSNKAPHTAVQQSGLHTPHRKTPPTQVPAFSFPMTISNSVAPQVTYVTSTLPTLPTPTFSIGGIMSLSQDHNSISSVVIPVTTTT